MPQTLETWYRSTISAKLNSTDTSINVATAPTATAWRMHIYKGNTHAWIKYTGVTGTTLTGVTFVSQTADPATTVTGTTFPAWTSIELVEMHDQMIDKQEWWTVTGNMIFSWNVSTTKSLKVPVYADTTARDVAITSPANGMVVYNTALWILQQYISGSWTSFATGTTFNADTTTAGKVEITTQAEFDAETDTGDTGASLSALPSQIKKAIRWEQTFIAWEALTLLDLVRREELFTWQVITTLPSVGTSQAFGDIAWNTRTSIRFIGNGVSTTTIILSLAKVASPTDSVTVRIETDTAWVPSGTLVNANATASVLWSGLTTGQVATTFTFAWAFTPTNNTPYHVVIARSTANDAVNYYSIGAIVKPVRSFVTNLYNASWGSAVTNKMYYLSYTGAYSTVYVKSSASIASASYYDGIVTTTTAIGGNVTVQKEGLSTLFSGLTNGSVYYMSNTAWAISTTAGTISRVVWYANWTKGLYIINPSFNNTLFDQTTVSYQNIVNTTGNTWTQTFYYRADTLVSFQVWFSSSATHNYGVYKNNTAVSAYTLQSSKSDTITLVPWDELSVVVTYGGSSTYVFQIANQQLLSPIWRYK